MSRAGGLGRLDGVDPQLGGDVLELDGLLGGHGHLGGVLLGQRKAEKVATSRFTISQKNFGRSTMRTLFLFQFLFCVSKFFKITVTSGEGSPVLSRANSSTVPRARHSHLLQPYLLKKARQYSLNACC